MSRARKLRLLPPWEGTLLLLSREELPPRKDPLRHLAHRVPFPVARCRLRRGQRTLPGSSRYPLLVLRESPAEQAEGAAIHPIALALCFPHRFRERGIRWSTESGRGEGELILPLFPQKPDVGPTANTARRPVAAGAAAAYANRRRLRLLLFVLCRPRLAPILLPSPPRRKTTPKLRSSLLPAAVFLISLAALVTTALPGERELSGSREKYTGAGAALEAPAERRSNRTAQAVTSLLRLLLSVREEGISLRLEALRGSRHHLEASLVSEDPGAVAEAITRLFPEARIEIFDGSHSLAEASGRLTVSLEP